MLASTVCRRAHWDTPWFARWNAFFADAAPPGGSFLPNNLRYHRKVWEWAAIAQALDERDMLVPGRRGCGFAVGREPLACLFAKLGIDVMATDLGASEGAAQSWSRSGQHAVNLDALYWPHLVDRATFDARVRFMPQDMRALEPARLGTYDFIWSACSLEHLGTLEAGLQFVLRSTELLRPGGVAVHTTEFNVSSLVNTIAAGGNVLYRRSDLDSLAARLRLLGCGMEPFDDFPGTAPEDIEYDYEPYYEHGREHVKLMISGFVSTSCLLIITKGRYPGTLPAMAALPLSPDAAAPGSERQSGGTMAALRRTALWRATAPLRRPLRRLLGRG
jgi:hypothetical protein